MFSEEVLDMITPNPSIKKKSKDIFRGGIWNGYPKTENIAVGTISQNLNTKWPPNKWIVYDWIYFGISQCPRFPKYNPVLILVWFH